MPEQSPGRGSEMWRKILELLGLLETKKDKTFFLNTPTCEPFDSLNLVRLLTRRSSKGIR